jgi:Tol biopolymer transport system component
VPEGIPAGPVLAAYDPAAGMIAALNAQTTPAQPNPPGIRLPLPSGCDVWSLHPSPGTRWLAVELECPAGPLVQAVHMDTGELRVMSPDLETDSHFLDWHPDGQRIYLRLDSLREPHIVRMEVNTGSLDSLPISPYTYDLAVHPNGERLLYTLTLGIGLGSETWLADADGRNAEPFLRDEMGLVTFARWSPDGGKLAYIRMPDAQVPFTVGQLFVLEDTRNAPRLVAKVDAGHGYAPAWSPDGTRLAFIVRDNPNDPLADRSYAALRSSLWVADLPSGLLTRFDSPESARVESPAWSPDGLWLVAAVAHNGTIGSWNFNTADASASVLRYGRGRLSPVWLPGR